MIFYRCAELLLCFDSRIRKISEGEQANFFSDPRLFACEVAFNLNTDPLSTLRRAGKTGGKVSSLFILTDVEKVAVNYGKSNDKNVIVPEAEEFLRQRLFALGSLVSYALSEGSRSDRPLPDNAAMSMRLILDFIKFLMILRLRAS